MAKISPMLEQAYKSHLPVLLEVLKRTSKPVLELGAGDGSTRQIHAATSSNITTIDNSKIWLSKFLDLQSSRHTLLFLSEQEMINIFFAKDTNKWGLVFVDSATWVGRAAAISKYKDTADYIIIHDTEYSAHLGFFGKQVTPGKRDFSEVFKQWIEFTPPQEIFNLPSTVVGSNIQDLKDFKINNMIITNTNI